MKTLFTTKEVYTADRCSKAITLKWARANGVNKFGRDYIWTVEQVKDFVKRNHRRGRPS